MTVLVIYNQSDTRCGFRNFGDQTLRALARAGHTVSSWDGTYPQVYARREAGAAYGGFFPPEVQAYDVVHVIYNAITLNHYAGAPWGVLETPGGPITSWWDGGPSDTTCPFRAHMRVKWSDYPREGMTYCWYPVPDWVTGLPAPDPAFTVGASSVRGDGVALIQEVCRREGWAVNLPVPGQWLTLEDEVRRLARSTVNVCWYKTPPLWKNRASAPSMLLASGRPLLVNQDPLVEHLLGAPDVYQALDGETAEAEDRIAALTAGLARVYRDGQTDRLVQPTETAAHLSWTKAAARFATTWEAARCGS